MVDVLSSAHISRLQFWVLDLQKQQKEVGVTFDQIRSAEDPEVFTSSGWVNVMSVPVVSPSRLQLSLADVAPVNSSSNQMLL